MLVLKILLYIAAILGFILSVCIAHEFRDDSVLVWFFASIPAASVAAWFLLPAYRSWVIYVNAFWLFSFICFGMCVEFGEWIYWHFKIKELRGYVESKEDKTKEFYSLHADILYHAKYNYGSEVSYKDCFRFHMIELEMGIFDCDNCLRTVVKIVREARISEEEYEKYRNRIEALENDHYGMIYGYGTDRRHRSKSGVKDKLRFRTRILS